MTPVCKCHGEPMTFHTIGYASGEGLWKCSIKPLPRHKDPHFPQEGRTFYMGQWRTPEQMARKRKTHADYSRVANSLGGRYWAAVRRRRLEADRKRILHQLEGELNGTQ